MMKHILISLLLIMPFCMHAQYREKSFMMPRNESCNKQYVGLTASQDTTISVNCQNSIGELYITGTATLNNWDSGHIRVTLTDSYNMEYLVYELYPLLADSLTTSFHRMSIETCVLDDVVPQDLYITVSDASFSLDSIYFVEKSRSVRASETNPFTLQEEQNKIIIDKLNANLGARDIPWRAGSTSMASLTFDEKKRMFGGTVPNLGGFEYYVGGIFVSPNYTQSHAVEERSSSPYVDEWDWRNRHGKNWNTPARDQENCSSCWVFASIATLESYINLYYNQLINYDLSEQEIVSCSSDKDACGGGLPPTAFNYIQNNGVVNEACFKYTASNNDCSNKGADPIDVISTSEQYSEETNSISYNLIKRLVISKPICLWLTSPLNHAVELVGYKTIQAGDTVYNDLDRYITIGNNSSLIGETAWIIKNSHGPDWGNQGFALLVPPNGSIFGVLSFNGEVQSNVYANDDVVCSDNDNDGYYYWGIGPKPAHCPSWAPDTPDGDDSDYTKGPVDEYGYLYDIPSMISDSTIYIAQDTEWNTRKYVYHNVYVYGGKTLRISNDINFYRGASLHLSSGSKLIIDGGSLTDVSITYVGTSGTSIQLLNNGTLNYLNNQDFTVPLGVSLEITNGKIN